MFSNISRTNIISPSPVVFSEQLLYCLGGMRSHDYDQRNSFVSTFANNIMQQINKSDLKSEKPSHKHIVDHDNNLNNNHNNNNADNLNEEQLTMCYDDSQFHQFISNISIEYNLFQFLPTILHLQNTCPFVDIVNHSSNIVECIEKKLNVNICGHIPPIPTIFLNPSSFQHPHETTKTLHQLFCHLFITYGRVSHLDILLSLQTSYLQVFRDFFYTLMLGNIGPLSIDQRYFLALMAASRYDSEILTSLLEAQFQMFGGDLSWIHGGLSNAPPKFDKISELNALIAHQPWKIKSKHIENLVKNGWTISEIVQATLIFVTFHQVSGFYHGFSLLPELDIQFTQKFNTFLKQNIVGNENGNNDSISKNFMYFLKQLFDKNTAEKTQHCSTELNADLSLSNGYSNVKEKIKNDYYVGSLSNVTSDLKLEQTKVDNDICISNNCLALLNENKNHDDNEKNNKILHKLKPKILQSVVENEDLCTFFSHESNEQTMEHDKQDQTELSMMINKLQCGSNQLAKELNDSNLSGTDINFRTRILQLPTEDNIFRQNNNDNMKNHQEDDNNDKTIHDGINDMTSSTTKPKKFALHCFEFDPSTTHQLWFINNANNDNETMECDPNMMPSKTLQSPVFAKDANNISTHDNQHANKNKHKHKNKKKNKNKNENRNESNVSNCDFLKKKESNFNSTTTSNIACPSTPLFTSTDWEKTVELYRQNLLSNTWKTSMKSPSKNLSINGSINETSNMTNMKQKLEQKEKPQPKLPMTSIPSSSGLLYSKYSNGISMCYQDFDLHDHDAIHTYDYNWNTHGYNVVARHYPGIEKKLDTLFHTAYTMTDYSVFSEKNINTEHIRHAVWHYAFRLFGITNDSYDYSLPNFYLTHHLKIFIKKIVCYPQSVTFRDIHRLGVPLRDDEKLHVAILALEAKKQASILFVLLGINKFMSMPSNLKQ